MQCQLVSPNDHARSVVQSSLGSAHRTAWCADLLRPRSTGGARIARLGCASHGPMRILITVAVGVAVLALSACSGPMDSDSAPGPSSEPPSTSAGADDPDRQSQAGTWVRRSDWGSVRGLAGQALYDEMCSSQSAYFDLMGDPVRTIGAGEFDREQFSRERVREMRSDPAWNATFSPADQELMIRAVLAAGGRSC